MLHKNTAGRGCRVSLRITQDALQEGDDGVAPVGLHKFPRRIAIGKQGRLEEPFPYCIGIGFNVVGQAKNFVYQFVDHFRFLDIGSTCRSDPWSFAMGVCWVTNSLRFA